MIGGSAGTNRGETAFPARGGTDDIVACPHGLMFFKCEVLLHLGHFAAFHDVQGQMRRLSFFHLGLPVLDGARQTPKKRGWTCHGPSGFRRAFSKAWQGK